MSENEPEAAVEPIDPVTVVQDALAQVGGNALAIGFACVVEWLDEDGARSLQVIHTDMPPWHLQGMLGAGGEICSSYFVAADTFLDFDDDDE